MAAIAATGNQPANPLSVACPFGVSAISSTIGGVLTNSVCYNDAMATAAQVMTRVSTKPPVTSCYQQGSRQTTSAGYYTSQPCTTGSTYFFCSVFDKFFCLLLKVL